MYRRSAWMLHRVLYSMVIHPSRPLESMQLIYDAARLFSVWLQGDGRCQGIIRVLDQNMSGYVWINIALSKYVET